MRILPISSYVPTIRGLIANAFAHEAVYPFYASFKITTRCHFGCPFCNMAKLKAQKAAELSTEQIKAILKNLSRSSVLMTSFEGGEPLLRDDIEELLAYSRSCAFYLLFTTSQRTILNYPMKRLCRYIDFLHVSIDEGHGNLELFDCLEELCTFSSQVSVQVVVTTDSVDSLDWKVERCYRSGANIVIIPATPMEGAKNCFPDIANLSVKIAALRKRFPNTIHTPQGYFDAYATNRCSSASVIIAPDGYLYYPCHILETKGANLVNTDLTQWLATEQARGFRKTMKQCTKNCGWYQYYSIGSYLCLKTVYESLRPILFKKKKLPE
ncbi:MAG: radical SAM protein [Chitinivibrionales bacterium]|nr:radical SAM protein [Chitinivibrionales bacterium]